MKSWIQTFSGRKFFPTDPDPKEIVIEDIAHALSMQCRFTGHVQDFYSVAEHSVRVAYLCPWEYRLAGLLHDASEAYLADVSSPVKHIPEMAPYREIESRLQKAIFRRFGVDFTPRAASAIHEADQVMLATEARDLKSPLHKEWRLEKAPCAEIIAPWNQKIAEDIFLFTFATCLEEGAEEF